MGNDFLKTNTPDVWTREIARIDEFTLIEKEMMKASIERNYSLVLQLSKWMLRLQMEVMEEKAKDGSKTTLIGIYTPTFQNQKAKIRLLEADYLAASKTYGDPAAKRNAAADQQEIVLQIDDLLDELFHNNTVLGLNYKKKNDPSKAALG